MSELKNSPCSTETHVNTIRTQAAAIGNLDARLFPQPCERLALRPCEHKLRQDKAAWHADMLILMIFFPFAIIAKKKAIGVRKKELDHLG